MTSAAMTPATMTSATMTSIDKLVLTVQPYYPYITLTGLTYIYMYIKFPHMLREARHWFDSRNRPSEFDTLEWWLTK